MDLQNFYLIILYFTADSAADKCFSQLNLLLVTHLQPLSFNFFIDPALSRSENSNGRVFSKLPAYQLLPVANQSGKLSWCSLFPLFNINNIRIIEGAFRNL